MADKTTEEPMGYEAGSDPCPVCGGFHTGKDHRPADKTTELGAGRLDICGTCGSQVRVVTSDEGTSYYASLTPADLAAEAFTRAELKALLSEGPEDEPWSDDETGDWEGSEDEWKVAVGSGGATLRRALALHDKGER